MRVHTCRLTLHESLFYATREVGRLYETGRYLHNYALTYALGLATAPYFSPTQVPRYAEQLSPLNARGIYVTPARGVRIEYQLATFKYADNAYHVEMEKGSRNTPSFGRAKEVSAGSVFEFAVLSEREAPRLPKWIRLGLWRSKAEVIYAETEVISEKSSEARADCALNPLDVAGQLLAFDLISMPPASLVDHAVVQTDWWVWSSGGGICRLPTQLAYRFPS
jgi:CRISPR-associated protein Csc1